MSTSIALLCEGASDSLTVRTLADRVIVEGVDWIDADDIDTHRHHRGFRPNDAFMTWFEIDGLAKQYNVKSRGHFEGLPLHGDGHNTRKALTLLALYASDDPPIEAVIVFRDGDREYDDRRNAILTVRDATPLPIPVVVGVANRVSESWIVSGFDPADEHEQARLDAELKRIGFDPRTRAHDLTEVNEGEDRCPKRVLRVLSGGDRDREQACLWETPLQRLRSRGSENGLNAFLDELETRLIAAFR